MSDFDYDGDAISDSEWFAAECEDGDDNLNCEGENCQCWEAKE